jgi:hypothetical protein
MSVKPLNVQQCELLADDLVALYFPSVPRRALFARYGVHGDGSCFFHSLCAAVDPNYTKADAGTQARMGHAYRSQFKGYLTDERWNQFVRRHGIETELTAGKVRSNFHDTTVWADEIMIRFVSSALKMNIVFIDMNNGTIYCGVHGRDDEPLVVVLWIDRSHFEPLCVITDVEGARCKNVNAQFQFHPQRDKDIVDAILHNYQAQCSTD